VLLKNTNKESINGVIDMNEKIKRVTIIGMLCAVAYIVMLACRIPIVLFLKYEPKDVIITLGGLIWGPAVAVLTSVIVSLVEMVTVRDNGIYGFIMNIVSTLLFCNCCIIDI
jgi:riboflavin transporter FmnP